MPPATAAPPPVVRLIAAASEDPAARGMAAALAASGLPMATEGAAGGAGATGPAVTLVEIRDPPTASIRPRTFAIGFWSWEPGMAVPAAWRAEPPVDEIWVPSRFAATAIAAGLPLPVIALPPAMAPPPAAAGGSAPAMPRDAFVFLAIVDDDGTAEHALAAYRLAWPAPAPGIVLALAGAAIDDRPPRTVRHLAAGRPDVLLLPGVADRGTLIAACGCYLSLHRAVGFGRAAATAMALGKPVVATAHSGNMDYMSSACAYLVRTTAGGAGASPSAEPDLRHAAQAMRRVAAGRDAAAATGAEAARRIRELLSPAAIGRRIRRRLALLHAAGLLERPRSPVRMPRPAAHAAPAALVYGHHATDSGVGIAARGTAAALSEAGFSVASVDVPFSPEPEETAAPPATPCAPAVTVLQAMPAILLNGLMRGSIVLPAAGTCGIRVGLWPWEGAGAPPPAWRLATSLVDEIWVPSGFIAGAVAEHVPMPVVVVPHALAPAPPTGGRADFALPADAFIFLFVFDGPSQVARKNPQGAIAAYRRAFPVPDPGVCLVIKTKGLGDEARALLRTAAGGRDDIRIIDARYDDATLQGLMAACDCYVSLHRAEGFGLTLAEAMRLGKPVIATGYSGNMEFMSSATAYPVGYRLVATESAVGPFPAGTVWAEPDLDHAAARMRHVVARPGEATAVGAAAAGHVAALLSPAAIGARMAERLAVLAAAGQAAPAGRSAATGHCGDVPTVLIATPIKEAHRHVERYLTLLKRLDYDPRRLSVAFLESDSGDGTHAALAARLPELEARHRRALLHRHDFGFRLEGPRWLPAVQRRRRSIIARARNRLLSLSLSDEEWVLWLDADLQDYPPDLLLRLLAAGKDIVVPHCVRPDGRTFDINTFRFDPAKGAAEDPSHMLDGLYQPPRGAGRTYLDAFAGDGPVAIDSVGGTALLVRADLHREGLCFPPAPYRGYIETEGLAMMARDMGHGAWALPGLRIVHVAG
ncbi:MAG: glycosyltransferase [Alphaproteobacteria bacterium]|nr:glycosyltransferase [Alphaproteobacteria bacterium]